MEVDLWVDGSSDRKDGVWFGGCGGILLYKGYKKEISKGFIGYTNNMAEIKAVTLGLQSLKKPCKVNIMSDSKYTIDCITSWIGSWARNGWRTSSGSPVKNKDLIIELYNECQRHDIVFNKVKAHSGIELNEEVDLLAKGAMREIRDNEKADQLACEASNYLREKERSENE